MNQTVTTALLSLNAVTSVGLAAADHWVASLVPAGVAIGLGYILTEPEKSGIMIGKILCALEQHDLRVVATSAGYRWHRCRRCSAIRPEEVKAHTVTRVRKARR